jgi:hypothetical protein
MNIVKGIQKEEGGGGGMIGEKLRKMHQSANIHMLEKHINMVLLTNFVPWRGYSFLIKIRGKGRN